MECLFCCNGFNNQAHFCFAFTVPPHESLIPENQQMAQHGQDIHGDHNPQSAEQPVCKKEENLEPQLGHCSGEDEGEDENNLDEDDDIGPSCSFSSEHDEEFEPDRLSLVQSKLLADWRPDPEAPESDQNENAGPSCSLGKCLLSGFGVLESFRESFQFSFYVYSVFRN